jgi:hypothetical protein
MQSAASQLSAGAMVRPTLVVLAGSCGAALASFAVRWLMAHSLAPADFGLVTLAIALASAAGGVATLGLTGAAAHRVALHLAHGRTAAARGAARIALGAGAAAGLVAAALLAGGAPALERVLGQPGLAVLLRALAPVAAALAVGGALVGTSRAFGDTTGRALLRDGLGGSLRLGGVAVALRAGGGPVGAGIGFAAGAVVAEAGLGAYAVSRGWLRGGAGTAADAVLLRGLPPFAAGTALAQAGQWFDVLLLGAVAPASVVGAYGVARGIERALELVSEAASHRFLPTATTIHARETPAALAAVYRQTRSLVLALLWPRGGGLPAGAAGGGAGDLRLPLRRGGAGARAALRRPAHLRGAGLQRSRPDLLREDRRGEPAQRRRPGAGRGRRGSPGAGLGRPRRRDWLDGNDRVAEPAVGAVPLAREPHYALGRRPGPGGGGRHPAHPRHGGSGARRRVD